MSRQRTPAALERTPMRTRCRALPAGTRTRAFAPPRVGWLSVEPPSDTDLVERVRAGDQQAWAELIARYGGRVWAVARSQGLDRERASDVVQTVWLNLLHGIDNIREPGAIAAWLVTVARREAIRVDRLSKRAVLVDEGSFERRAAVTDDLDRVAIRNDNSVLIQRAVGHLGDRCRELLRLLYSSDELSYTEIAATMQMPIGSVGPTRARCLDRLRTLATAEGLTR
jgi:RNA polymerase sigma factor (sigma-70 family)